MSVGLLTFYCILSVKGRLPAAGGDAADAPRGGRLSQPAGQRLQQFDARRATER